MHKDFKDLVFESIRGLNLSLDDKRIVAMKYASVTEQEKFIFEHALKSYSGRVTVPFREKLYDRYVYAIRAKDDFGNSMTNYLLNNERGFLDKHSASFFLSE